MAGFVLSYRKIWENPIFEGNAMRVGVWDWMLKMAAFKDTTFVSGADVIEVSRGQLCVSQSQITKATGMARQPLRTFIILLEKTGAIATKPATKSTKGRTLITICNYNEYQAQQPRANQTPTKRQPTKEQGNNVNKEAKASKDADAIDILSAIVPKQLAVDFAGHRRDLKKPLNERSAAAMVAKLDGHHDPNAVLTNSIANGWQGIFPDKIKSQFKAINGGRNERPDNTQNTKRIDPAIANIARIVGLDAP